MDRLEDISDPEQKRVNPKGDRTISLYGYVRGTNLKRGFSFYDLCLRFCHQLTEIGMKVHIPGCGDHEIASVHALPDPCPPPERDPDKRKRRLNEKGTA